MPPSLASSTFTSPPSSIFTTISGTTFDPPDYNDYAIDGVLLLPLNLNTDNRFSQYEGRVYEALPPQPLTPPPPPPPLPPHRQLQVERITGFKSIQSLPEKHLSGTPDAVERLVALKQFINRLQKKRKSYWERQTAATGAVAGLAFFTVGGALVGGAMVAYQREQLDIIKGKIRQAIRQINSLRSVYGNEQYWQEAEAMVRIDSNIFDFAIQRTELQGSL